MATIAADPGVTTANATQYILSTYYDKVFLERLQPACRWDQLCEKKKLPQNQGKIVKFSAFKQLTAGSKLTEMTRPTAKALSAFNVTARIIQYGDYVGVSDLLELEGISSTIEQAVGIMGDQCAMTIDQKVATAAWGGIGILPSATSNISASLRARYTGSVSTLSALNGKVAGFTIRLSKQCSGLLAATGRLSTCINHAASAYNAASKITLKDLRDAVGSLRTRNVQPFTSDGYYMGIAHPAAIIDIMSDTSTGGWIDWQKYSRPKETMMKGEIGECEGIRIISSSQAIDRAANRGASVSATVVTVVGKGALAIVDFDKHYDNTGKNFVIIKKGGQMGGMNDPLDQVAGTVGWKVNLAACVLNTSCGIHVLGLRNVSVS